MHLTTFVSNNQIDWLYQPSFVGDWEERPLHALDQWVNGLAFRNIQFSATGMPVIKIAEIRGGITGQTKFTQQSFDISVLVSPGDLLFSWSGQPETSIDAFWWNGPVVWPNQHVFRVTPDTGIDRVFFNYLLKYLKPNFVGIARNKQTTGLGHVTRHDLENIVVGLPPLPEQRAIAHILGALDDKIELNRRMNQTLEEMARATYKDWFVDFGPVRAKLEGREPYLPPELRDLFPDRLVDSELGKVKALGDIAVLNPEAWSKAHHPEEIQYVDLANTKWGLIESTQHFHWNDAPSRARRFLRTGDTIVGTVRPGNGSYSLMGNDGLTGSTGFAVLRPLEPWFRELVYLTATAPDNIHRLAHRADGAAYPAVRPEIVSETEVAVPIAEAVVMDWFSATVGPVLDKTEAAKAESHALAAQRDALLPRLVSGELRVCYPTPQSN